MCAGRKRGTLWRRVRTLSPRPRRRYFADLADAQTINRDKKGGWKAPLWQALTEAGLPLSWVPEDCGGSGASLAEGFSVLSAAGRFAIAVPLAETMLAGWLLAQAKIASPEGAMTVAPASPKDRITLNADGTLSGRARGVPFAKDAKHIAVLAQRQRAAFRSRWSMPATCRIEAGLNLGGDGSDTVTFDNVAAGRDQAGAERLRPDRADADGRRWRAACRSRARWNRCSTSACAIPTSASRSRRRSRNSRRCSTIWRGSPASPRRRWPRRPRRPMPSPTRTSFDDAVFLEAAVGKNPLRGGRRKGRGDRPSGAWRDRLHHRAHPASLHPARAGLARRFRLTKATGRSNSASCVAARGADELWPLVASR